MVCARWLAQGGKARAYTRTAAEELAELARTHGVALPEKASATDISQDATPDATLPDLDAPVWTPESFAPAPGQPPQLWPCWRWALALWLAMRTQWRSAGMAGAFIGLDYAALATVEQRIGLPKSEQQQAFAGLQVIERAQLAQWREDEKAQALKDKHG